MPGPALTTAHTVLPWLFSIYFTIWFLYIKYDVWNLRKWNCISIPEFSKFWNKEKKISKIYVLWSVSIMKTQLLESWYSLNTLVTPYYLSSVQGYSNVFLVRSSAHFISDWDHDVISDWDHATTLHAIIINYLLYFYYRKYL